MKTGRIASKTLVSRRDIGVLFCQSRESEQNSVSRLLEKGHRRDRQQRDARPPSCFDDLDASQIIERFGEQMNALLRKLHFHMR